MSLIQAFPTKIGTKNFEELENRPKINNFTLTSSTTLEDIGVVGEDDSLTQEQLDNILDLI